MYYATTLSSNYVLRSFPRTYMCLKELRILISLLRWQLNWRNRSKWNSHNLLNSPISENESKYSCARVLCERTWPAMRLGCWFLLIFLFPVVDNWSLKALALLFQRRCEYLYFILKSLINYRECRVGTLCGAGVFEKESSDGSSLWSPEKAATWMFRVCLKELLIGHNRRPVIFPEYISSEAARRL